MKHSPNAVQEDPHSGSSALGYFSTQSNDQRFDVLPWDIRSLGLLEYLVEGLLVLPIQHITIVPCSGIMSSSFFCIPVPPDDKHKQRPRRPKATAQSRE